MTMKKVLYVGHLRNRSYGDQVAFTVFRDFIKKHYSNKIELHTKDIKASKTYNIVNGNYDFYLLGGGTCISDLMRPYADRILHHFYNSKCRYGILGAGVYSESRRDQKIVCERTIKSIQHTRDFIIGAKYVGVRDKASKEYLDNIGCGDNINVMYDPCLAIEYPKVDLNLDITKPTIGMNICLNNKVCLGTISYDQNKLFKAMEEFVKAIVHKYNVLFIPFNRADSKLANRVKEWGCNIADWGTPSHIAGVMQNCDYYVGNRVHGDVTAAAYNIPFVSIGYTEPNINFLKHIDYPYYIDPKIEHLSFESIKLYFFKIIMDEIQVVSGLKRITIVAKASYNENAHKLCEVILNET